MEEFMEIPRMRFTEAVKTCFKKSFVFKGRARRSEYWWWVLFSFLLGLVVSIVGEFIPTDNPWVAGIYSLIVILGSLYIAIVSAAANVRRLHDVGLSGWWYGGTLIYLLIWIIWITVECVRIALNLNLAPNATPDMVSNAILMQLIGKILITYIPYMIYSVVLLVFYCLDSKPGANKYGDNPKGVPAEEPALQK